jgi:hypothetical protein
VTFGSARARLAAGLTVAEAASVVAFLEQPHGLPVETSPEAELADVAT